MIIGADGAFSSIRGSMQMSDRFEYSQHYIEHGYKELRIPPGANGEFVMEKEALHIWPRASFMLIALPNPDATFTCTLFFPFEGEQSFQKLNRNEDVQEFFDTTFPDAAALMPSLIEDFRDNTTSSLVTIKSYPWVRNKTMIIGDAAHGVVPFYGQGMNAGFEDCSILTELFNKHGSNLESILSEFSDIRWEDCHAISDLAMYNYVEVK